MFFTVLFLALPAGSQAKTELTYYKDIRPILRRHCTVCHKQDNLDDIESSGGLALDKAELLFHYKPNKLISVGKPNESDLFTRLIDKDPVKRMPKADKPLSPDKIEMIRRWIETGAKIGEPVTSKPVAAKPKTIRRFRDISFPTTTTPPPLALENSKAGALSLVAKIGPLAPITSLALSADDRYLAVGSFQRIVVWNRQKGTVEHVVSDVRGMVLGLEFSPDSKTLWMCGGEPSEAGDVSSFETATWKKSFHFDCPSDAVISIAVSADGKLVAASGYDRMFRIWSTNDGKLLQSVRAHGDAVCTVAFSPDAKLIATGGRDAAVKVWDRPTGRLVRTFSAHTRDVLSVSFSADGKFLYSCGLDPQLRKWDLTRGAQANVVGGFGGSASQMAWNRTADRFAIAGADQTVRVFRPDGGVDRTLIGAADTLFSAAISADRKVVVGGTWDGKVLLWNPENNKPAMTLVSAARNDSQEIDWLAIQRSGWISASPTIADRAQWRVGDQSIPFVKGSTLLGRSAEIVKAFTGDIRTANPFPPKQAVNNKNTAARKTAPKGDPKKAPTKSEKKQTPTNNVAPKTPSSSPAPGKARVNPSAGNATRSVS